MRLKQFMFALVAMLSFTFSALAQTTVTTEAELKTAMSSGGAVVLGADIELKGAVVIPKKVAIVLDLNGYSIEGVTTGVNGITLESNASLTINDSMGTGVITAKSYVLNGAGGSKIILNAGKIYRSSWAVYTTGSFTINGGTVECKDGSMAIRVAGSGTITLNGGTVTSVQISGGTLNVQNDDATITSGIQLDKGAKDVNITAGTVNGKVTVAPEAQDKLTVSGGTFGDPDAVKDYLEDGLVIENGQVVAGMFKIEGNYYPTLAEAAAAAQVGQTIVLLKDTEEAYVLPAGVKFDKNGFNAPNIYEAVAKVGNVLYGSLQAAVNAVQNDQTITLVANVEGTVTLAEKVGLYYTIDGANKTMNGTMTVTALSDNNDNRRITIKDINFVDEDDNKSVDFISSVNTNHYPRLTIEGCTFTGSGYEKDKDQDVAIRLKSANSAIIKNCTGTGLHSFLQNTSGWNLTVDDVTVTESNGGLALGTVQGVTVKNSNVTTATYGIRLDADTYNNNAVIESNTVNAFIPVVVRKVNTESNIAFTGENEFTASNTDGLWCAIGKGEYEENGKMPEAPATGKVTVQLTDTGLSKEGLYGNYVPVAKIGDVEYASLEAAFEAAAATAEATITLIEDLTIDSDLNNAGKGYFNVADGKKVTLDLGGKTITATDNSTGNFILFYSYGEFTIKNGTVVLTATNDRDWNAQSTIVLNRGGIFNCESGTYTHNGGTDMAYVFDNSGNYYGDATTNIKGGELTSSYIAIRNRMEQNTHGASGKAILNVTGGKINGTSRAVWAQAASTNETAPATGAINVSGGEVGLIDTPRGTGAVSMTTISGGTVAAFKGEAGELTVKGGTITGDVTILTAAGEATDYAITADGVYAQAVAKVGEVKYTDIQEAIKAAAPAGTVDVLADVTVDKWIMFAEKMTIGDGSLITLNINGLTINGNNKTMTVKSIESAGNGGYLFYDAQNLTVKDLTINIADGLVGGIGLQQGTISNVTFNGGQYGVLPGKNGVTVSGCTFNDTKGYAVYYEDERPGIVVTGNTFNTADGAYAITMRNNEQFTDNTVVKGRVNLANSAASTVSGNDFGTERFKVYNDATATISNNKINNLVFNATDAPAASTFTADNTLSTEAQAAIEALPLMAGEGTEANPYTIASLAQLKAFRDDVNEGNNYQGKFVKLTADIDLNNEEWTPIGNITYDSKYKPADASKVFSGVFNGNGKVISNLKVASNVGGADTQANVGLFGITGEGAVIKDLTLTNVNIETDGRNVGAIAGFAYKATLKNITVNGNIQIKGGNNVAGIAGMTRYYAMSATGISVIGNDGSAIVGNNIVGGIFAEIAPNGSEQKFDGLNVENVAITGVGGVGGIVGLLTTGAVENVSVKNVVLTGRTDYQGNAMGRIRLGSVAGLMGSKYATIANETVENVTAKNLDGNAVELPVIGANYDAASNATEAKIGNKYYATFATAYTAAQAGETVTLLADLTMSEILVLDKAITLDGNGKKLTSTAGRAINVDCEGNVAIKNLTINASGERAINVIQKPANVTIENVTATAANYTVNLASSAGAAKVAIKNSNLTGLNVVNVASAGAEVTIDGGTITCNDQTDAENYAALALNKDGKNATIAATGVTFDIKGDSKKAKNGAEGGVITIDGESDEVDVIVAYISYGNYYYSFTSIEAAIAKANDGETIGLIRDITASDIITIDKAITLDGNGKKLTSTAGRAINVDCEGNVAIKNLTINASGERAINVIQKPANVTIENVTATAANYTVNLASSAGAAKVAIKNSNLTGLNVVNVAAAGAEVTIDGGTITCNDQTDAESYAALALNKDGKNATIAATGVTFDIKGDSKKASNGAVGGVITIDGKSDEVDVIVAAITYEGSDYYNSFATLEDAIEFAKAGETITLLSNVTVANKIVINKSITLDGNGKTLTYTGTDRAIDVPNDANANIDVTVKNLTIVATTANRGLNYNENGQFNVEGVTVTIGENVDGYAINFPGMADGAQVTIKDSKLTSRNPLNIWGENMTINVHNSEIISVDNSTTYDYAAIQLNNEIPTVGPNGAIANGTVVNVYGGVLTATDEKGEPSNVVANATETGVVNISDETTLNGTVINYVANIGGAYFGSLQAAVDAIEKHGYNSPIVIMKSFATSETATVKNGLNVTIDLNGKTISVTDNTTKNFEVIKNQGTLTIKDSSADKTGKITVTATTNSGWNRYSAVIANTVGGKLTVEGGTLEHLGGTDMAYGIDNLTNGKGTYAETIINGGTIKSTYRAIRQFLNGTEAQNILTINGGTIEGANKSVFMHDPNKNANTGTLTVAEDAKLTGDVYLFVTAGSTEWPVEVSIAAAALDGESKVMTGYVPAGYELAEVDGTYGVFSGIAKIGTTYYNTLTDAIAAVNEGETIVLIGNIDTTGAINIPAGKKLVLDLNGKTITGTDNNTASYGLININSGAELTINDTTGEGAIKLTATNNRGWNAYSSVISNQRGKLVVNGGTIEHLGGTDMAYGIDNLTNGKGTYAETIINGGTIKSTYRAIRQFLNGTEAQNILTINGGTIEGANKSVWMQNANAKANPGALTVAEEAAIKGDVYVSGSNATEWPVAISVANEALKDGAAVVASKVPESIVIVNNNGVWGVASSVASANGVGYASLAEAVTAAADGATVTLLADITMTTKDYVTITDNYAVLVAVKEKAITIDLNGKDITVNASAEDLTETKNTMLMSVFGLDTNGKLTIIDSQNSATVTVNANDATVYSIAAAYGEGSKLTINGGTFKADKVGDSMLYSQYDELVTINGGSFILGNVGTGSNGKPWLFNGKGQNTANATVYGGTFNADVNHQHWAHEVVVPETLALKDNGDGTWTVVPSVAYNVEIASGYERMVGYATFEDAFAATNNYNCKNNTVVVVKDVAVENTITVASDVTVVLDLNGKVLSMNDASGKGAYAIKNQGNLTIADNSEAKTGKITFNSTTPDNSFGYATSTIGNAGQLTVNSGTIENTTVGGASYAIDGIWHTGDVSLTINGGTIVANKIAVRQVPFSATAKNVVTVKGGTLTGATAGLQLFNTNNDAKLAEVNIHGGVFNGSYAFYTTFTSAAASDDVTINIDGGEFNGYLYLYNGNNGSHEYPMTVSVTGGTFNGGAYIYTKDANGAEVAIRSIAGGTFANNVDEYCAVGYISKANDDNTYNVVVNPEYGKIAQIGNGGLFENQYFATLNDAAQAAKTGDVIKLIADVNISAAGYATVDEENQYSTMMAVKEKDITLDMNGKTITVTPTADEVADAEMQMLMSVFGMDTNGKLTITGNGTVKVVANGANVYSIVTAYGEGSLVTIENGNFEADKLMLSGSLLYSQQSECIIVNGGNFKLGNLADPDGQNGQPWIFNTKGQNYTGAIVNGGTFPTDINHQFWAHEVRVPETKALKANEDGTWTVVDAVAYTTEKASSRGSYFRNIGYASIEDAIAATDKYNCQNNTVTLIKDIAIEKMITVTNGTTVVLDLAGKTITGTDNATASFGLITNKGDLTITDSSEEAAGKITLTATQNRGWSAYSSVISNQVGGKLTVDAGTIEHLGGTSMAWGIDNLTNGKGTYAETIINGGVVKSAYIAIRQFLNGVEAQNILTVNGGTLQGGTASLYFQDPSKNANTGTLDVFEDATLAGDVYLDVTEGSTEWPVEVYITKAALGEYLIHTENIPEDAAALVEYDEFWQVEQKNLAELTIDDAEYSDYINKIVKNVAVLTYERSFDDTEWQTLYLPFEVPVENLLADFEVAYIYNAGYKNNVATIDYVVIDENSAVTVLAANYPYLIRAKEAGDKSIVVENAKLMPTVVNTIDCSSVFEKFVFAGNYSTLDASTLDAKKGYFDMNAGNWSRMDVLNPFRVYMQIEVRNGDGSDFVYPTDSQSIRMRSVDVNGNGTTGINGVDAEQNADYIFDLQGRRVLEPQKGGIYIVNGKKVIF